ncbi:MAG: DUF4124 domain-containing protein [Thermodesulfovibrionales bacterium]|jgi:hypothetical protein
MSRTGMILGICNRRLFVLPLLIAAAQFCVCFSPALSEVYQWTDENGQTIYSNAPPPGVNAKLKKLRIDRIEKLDIKNPPAKAVKDIQQKRDLRDITVILYATDW